MKLHADHPHQLSVTAHGEGWVAINGQRYTGSLFLGGSGVVRPWPPTGLHELTVDHIAQLLADEETPPELVVFGTGKQMRFVKPALLQPLIDRRIGIESMDTAAACRTYNILAGEGRRVVAALLIEA